MTFMHVTADQMSAAAGYLARNWGESGYWFEGVESPTLMVSVFRVACSDGSRFSVVADRWGNCRDLDTHDGDEGLADLVREMHAEAVMP